MRWIKKITLSALLSLITVALWAQERGDYQYEYPYLNDSELRMIEVDTTLFRLPINLSSDPYSDATRYYREPISTRRRGLYYSVANDLVASPADYLLSLEQPLPQSKVALYAAQSKYRVGLSASSGATLASGWSYYASLWSSSGRDMFVDGVFSNTLSPEIALGYRFDDNHFLTINASLYYSMRGLQSGSTSEAFSLVGSSLYNPSWGFYHGEVRNSRVRRSLNPTLALHYQRAVDSHTTFVAEVEGDYSRQANSSLGWYNATTPMPDYYRYLPSYLSEGEAKDYVTNVWRVNDTAYTQVNWDELERLNSLSSDGNAYYVVEDRVEREMESSATLLLVSNVGERLTLSYGAEIEARSSRNFKVMRDLLGASFLYDYDLFMGDSYNKTIPLQNNLQDPDRQVTEGDRFGYDYTITTSCMVALLRARYRAARFDFDLDARIGGQSTYRTGHYEKERFAASASLGSSATISSSPYQVRASIGYAVGADKYFALKVASSRLESLPSNLFLDATLSNYLAPSLGGEEINSAAFVFRYNSSAVSLYGELYALQSRGGSSLYSLYDDLTSTMCRASITEIGYSSYGVELTADFSLHHDLKLSSTLAAGRYLYDTDPYVELFDSYSLSIISSATSSRMSGISIGNAPQVTASASATYFGFDNYIVSLTAWWAGARYTQPSIVRRSERLLTQAFLNEESAAAALEQQQLDNIFDLELGVSRFFWFEDGGRFSVRLVVRNLLGQSDRIYYAKESDRVTLQSVDDNFSGATLREGLTQYGLPRTIQLSATYQF